MERRLAAILAADVVGYSRLIRADEEGTLDRLKALRKEIFDPKIAEHNGRIVKLMGDGMLAEFASVVDAVRAAIEAQRSITEHNAGVPEEKRIVFRIGINLGDVVIDGDDIHGDGVNIAARLEGLAKPGGVCITGMVYEGVRDRIDVPFEDLGDREVKNIDRPVRVWQWVADGRSGKAPQTPERLRPFTGALRLVVRYFWFDSNPQERWQRFAEQVILHRIKHAVGRPNGFTGSIRQLKIMADREMARTMRLITTIPLIGLIVAALGAGNLMMANVTVRIRQIAILRAIGTTKWQVVRLILAEAFILGALGTAFGCAAGLYLARSINVATLAVWGYEPVWRVPWDMVLGGAALTMSICLIAGIFPARYAARSNIIAAMAAT